MNSRFGAARVALAIICLTCGCGDSGNTSVLPSSPTATLPSSNETAQSAHQPLYGDDINHDDNGGTLQTFMQDTVVRLSMTGGGLCSGTLITPTVVLTAAHCLNPVPSQVTVYFGPYNDLISTKWRIITTATNYQTMSDGSGPEADIGVVYLPQFVMDVVNSRRPMVWNGWTPWAPEPSLDKFNSSDNFGMAGWSPLAHGWDCDILGNMTNDQTTSADAVYYRRYAEGMTSDNFFRYGGTNVIAFNGDQPFRATEGDSGGPFYRTLPDGAREVVGVDSHFGCNGVNRYNTYTDVTGGATLNWLRQTLGDSGRSQGWLDKHGKTSDYWVGEVDYVGTCQPGRDADCDHWYDEHDYCPYEYDPYQTEGDPNNDVCVKQPFRQTVNGSTRAPAPYTSSFDTTTTVSGACPPGGSNCKTGFCYWHSLHGPFWQSTAGSSDFSSTTARRTALAVRAENGSYVIHNSGRRQDQPANLAQEPTTGAGGDLECTNFDEIASIPDPANCVYSTQSFADPSGSISTGSQSISVAGSAGDIIPAMTGFLGDISQQFSVPKANGSGVNILADFNDIHFSSSPVALTWKKATNLQSPPYFHGGSQRDVFGFACGTGTTFNVIHIGSSTTSDVVQSAPGTSDVQLIDRDQTKTARCFISGLEGAWARTRSLSAIQPYAQIYVGNNGETRLRVSPNTLLSGSNVDDRVTATATCFALRESE